MDLGVGMAAPTGASTPFGSSSSSSSRDMLLHSHAGIHHPRRPPRFTPAHLLLLSGLMFADHLTLTFLPCKPQTAISILHRCPGFSTRTPGIPASSSSHAESPGAHVRNKQTAGSLSSLEQRSGRDVIRIDQGLSLCLQVPWRGWRTRWETWERRWQVSLSHSHSKETLGHRATRGCVPGKGFSRDGDELGTLSYFYVRRSARASCYDGTDGAVLSWKMKNWSGWVTSIYDRHSTRRVISSLCTVS